MLMSEIVLSTEQLEVLRQNSVMAAASGLAVRYFGVFREVVGLWDGVEGTADDWGVDRADIAEVFRSSLRAELPIGFSVYDSYQATSILINKIDLTTNQPIYGSNHIIGRVECEYMIPHGGL